MAKTLAMFLKEVVISVIFTLEMIKDRFFSSRKRNKISFTQKKIIKGICVLCV
jgi:hypothetical protein